MPNGINNLNDFLTKTKDIFDDVVPQIRELVPKRTDVHEDIEKAWEEIKRDFYPRIFSELIICDPEKLKRQGLSGAMLDLKLKEFIHRVDQWKISSKNLEKQNKLINIPGAQTPQIKDRFFRKLLHKFEANFQLVVTAIDNILDSLANVVGVAHALKEFKETLGSIVKD